MSLDDEALDLDFVVGKQAYGPNAPPDPPSKPGPVKRIDPATVSVCGPSEPPPERWYAHDTDRQCQLCSEKGYSRGHSPIAAHHMHEIAQHSSRSQEHYTPARYVEAARATMGRIDCDPATCELANTIVQAPTWYGYTHDRGMVDGLSMPWHGCVFLNPPGGYTRKARPDLANIHQSYPMIWWARLVAEYQRGTVQQAVFVAFKLEQLSQSQHPIVAGSPSMLDFDVCITDHRIPFDYPDWTSEGRPTPTAKRKVSKQPSHGNAFIYLGTQHDMFRAQFSQFGRVLLHGH